MYLYTVSIKGNNSLQDNLIIKRNILTARICLRAIYIDQKNYKKVNEYPIESKPHYQCTLVDPTVHLPDICVRHFRTPSQSGPLLQVLPYPWQLIVFVRIQRVVCHISYTYTQATVITVQGKIYGTWKFQNLKHDITYGLKCLYF